MAISVNAEALEAKYGGKTGAAQPVPMQDLYSPGSGQAPNKQGQIPHGTPVPEGAFVQQVVGRGMAIIPPKVDQPPGPQVGVIPPQHGSRTTIGTIVEPSKGPEPDPPTEPQPLKPKVRRELDLGKLILEHIWELGGAKAQAAQDFYERSHDSLERWQKQPVLIPLGAVMKFIQRKPGVKADILDELEPHFAANGQEGWTESLPNRTKTSVIICSPVLERPSLPYLWAVAYLCKKYELGLQVMSDTVIHRSRNMLAHRFLQSGSTWSLWIDSDMIVPIKNKDWFQWITGGTAIPEEYQSYDVLERLLASGKAIVGGVYSSRKFRGQLVIQPEIRPRSHDDKLLCNEIRRGTARGLHEVNWIGFGCSLVHREVFLEVQRQFPQLAPEAEYTPWRFFQPEGDEGEDEAFCKRVKACGIPIWLDSQLVCGHVGNMCFLPEHSVPPPMMS